MSIFKKKQTLFGKSEDCCDEQQISQINLRLDNAEADIDQLETDVSNIISGGGGTQDLSSVLSYGNMSGTNSIYFEDVHGLIFDNGSQFRKGTSNGNNGGYNGVSQFCSLSYELKWEAGRLYAMEQDGFTIRWVLFQFGYGPSVGDDDTQGYVVGSRWTLDNGDTYICVDNTTGAAVWNLEVPPASSLQDVLIAGNSAGSNNIDLNDNSIENVNVLELSTTLGTNPNAGQITWNDTTGTAQIGLKGGNVDLNIGQDLIVRAVNKITPNTNVTKANYQAVRVSGATGQRLSFKLAQADADANSASTIGLIAEDINANQEGFIMTVGQLTEINTTGSLQGETWADGNVLYLSPTTAGQITNVKPSAPQHLVIIGYVEYAHAVHGKIYVKVDNGYELNELHDVTYPTTLANGEILQYNGSSLRWENTVPKIQVLVQTSANSAHTGTTNNTLIYSKLISANVVGTGDMLQISTKFTKPSGSTANPTVRIYVNTAASLSGATLLATYATTNLNGRFFLVERTANVDGATTNFLTTTSGALTDSASLATTAASDVSIDWTVDQYFIVAIQLGNAGDSTTFRMANVILNKAV